MQKYLICGIVASIKKAYMTRFKTYTLAIFSVLLISSCSSATVEEDVEEYCKCIETVKGGFEMRECIGLAQELRDKYGNSPKDAKYIEENIKRCGSTER
ncbi:MAG: hypothetical protein HRT57_12250 [Crocinitomicaceae bacterium]|nr:hypothetical protein [Crocinitomicaceae bacterium]